MLVSLCLSLPDITLSQLQQLEAEGCFAFLGTGYKMTSTYFLPALKHPVVTCFTWIDYGFTYKMIYNANE
jgi:hypothetical protein